MEQSPYISESPLFQHFLEKVNNLNPSDPAQVAKCQDLAEKLSILGRYINRTRRVQVTEQRPLREPIVLVVEYSSEEWLLYETIWETVRRQCRSDNRPFHVFQSIGLQLRSASCLPVMAQELREGRFGNPADLITEALGEEVWNELEEDDSKDTLMISINSILNYDFEKNDSKYKKLRHMLLEILPEEKVIIFSCYRPTLNYLRRRLVAEGLKVAMIHGDVPMEERQRELERFEDHHGPRILLSSEVGSEGIDLQFCRVVVN